MVLPNDRIKILDFGLACQLGTEDEHIGGALAYQAPELLEGEPVDQSTDIYALGITAYELVTGKRPFDDKEISQMFRLGSPREIADPALLAPDILPELRHFILKACRHDKKQRYQNAGEALEELHPFVSVRGKQVSDENNRRKLTTIILRYDQKQQAALNSLLSEFSTKTNAIDVDFKLMDLSD